MPFFPKRKILGPKYYAYRFGLRAELAARVWLRVKGYRIVSARTLTPYGEIDIIAERLGTLAFVEVKARPDVESGLYAITFAKRRHIERAAASYLAHQPIYAGHDIRFDLMLCRPFRLPRHIPDAWRP